MIDTEALAKAILLLHNADNDLAVAATKMTSVEAFKRERAAMLDARDRVSKAERAVLDAIRGKR